MFGASVLAGHVRAHSVALAGLFLTFACMEAPREQRAKERDHSEPAAAATVAPKPAPKLWARRALPPPQPVAEPIDPALVPVEEDFRGEVERSIDRRTDLALELQRVSRELAKRQ